MRRVLVLSIGVSLSLPIPLQAQSLLVAGTDCSTPYSQNSYNCANWTTATAFINSAFQGEVTWHSSALSDLNQMLFYDALWVDQRGFGSGPALSSTEISNIQGFARTGRRVVLIGENSSWPTWNASLASVVGGTYMENETRDGTFTPALAHALTSGVSHVYLPAGGEIAGGTALFGGTSFASLWGAEQNVLTVLDSNLQDSYYISQANNSQFVSNTGAWLAASSGVTVTPEPISMVLLGTGLIGIGAAGRRHRKNSAR